MTLKSLSAVPEGGKSAALPISSLNWTYVLFFGAFHGLAWVSVVTYGEGWHNNHHTYPNVAKAGFRWWEIDVTWWSIKVLKSLGLAKKVIMPPV